MKIIFDAEKNEKNKAKHGLSFEQADQCDWKNAFIREDVRQDYGEVRYSALLLMDRRLYNIVFTERDDAMRIISFRKANEKERKLYDKEIHRI